MKKVFLFLLVCLFNTSFAQPGYMGSLNYVELSGTLSAALYNANYSGNHGLTRFNLSKGISYNRVLSRSVVMGVGYQHTRTGLEVTQRRLGLSSYDVYNNSSYYDYEYYDLSEDVLNSRGDDPFLVNEDNDDYYYRSDNSITNKTLFFQKLKVSTLSLDFKVFGSATNLAAPIGTYWGVVLKKHNIYFEDSYTEKNVGKTDLFEFKFLMGTQKIYYDRIIVSLGLEVDASIWNWGTMFFNLDLDDSSSSGSYSNNGSSDLTLKEFEEDVMKAGKNRVSQMGLFNAKIGVSYLF